MRQNSAEFCYPRVGTPTRSASDGVGSSALAGASDWYCRIVRLFFVNTNNTIQRKIGS